MRLLRTILCHRWKLHDRDGRATRLENALILANEGLYASPRLPNFIKERNKLLSYLSLYFVWVFSQLSI